MLFRSLNAGKQPEEALEEMLDWIFADHETQITYHGCPVGNLIIELSKIGRASCRERV